MAVEACNVQTGDALRDLGLTEAEEQLYIALLRNGEGTASALAKKAGVDRRLAYDKIEALQEKGLVSYIDREQKRVYKPTNPERLRELVEDRREGLNELEARIDDVLPEMMRHFTAEKEEREVRVLQGKDAIKQLFNDQLREADDTIHLMGSPEESEELLEYFLPSWTKQRQERGIEIKGVFEHRMKGEVGDHPPIETRFLPPGHDSKVSISIYGEKVGIIFWIQDPLVIMIEDPEAADSFMSYFDLMWAGAEREDETD